MPDKVRHRRRRRKGSTSYESRPPVSKGVGPPVSDALSSDEDESAVGRQGQRREIPGFYYDPLAKAYFAVPKGGCTVGTEARLRAERRAMMSLKE
eukprot:CAMPEP_0114117104 /NCGR_PEP_ID=MMETSP0043_2-20121206/4852_1 /TAXON_ID=464988 /ORGANISM="Hemiselmis andersenii, Strain CCMP644" /LENGTH=94 /DNA_ID=CAMNT_0001209467 /DNA_START=32 /DNA_END=313 /DNA_ORIENTATION=-